MHDRMVGQQIAAMAYGFKVKDLNDPYLKLAQASIDCAAEVLSAGFHFVDMFPIRAFSTRI